MEKRSRFWHDVNDSSRQDSGTTYVSGTRFVILARQDYLSKDSGAANLQIIFCASMSHVGESERIFSIPCSKSPRAKKKENDVDTVTKILKMFENIDSHISILRSYFVPRMFPDFLDLFE